MENRWSTGHCCHLLCKWYMYVPYNSYIVVTSHFNVCFALIKCTENYNHNLKRLFTLFTCKKTTWLKYWGMKDIKILNLYSILLYTELIATNKYFSLSEAEEFCWGTSAVVQPGKPMRGPAFQTGGTVESQVICSNFLLWKLAPWLHLRNPCKESERNSLSWC